MVEIKIKISDSQSYTLLVDKSVPVPALKKQIASVTGIVTEQQHLIFGGQVLKDDQLLSAYHVEDGHTLHLVVRQPVTPLSESSTSDTEADPAVSAGNNQQLVVERPYQMLLHVEVVLAVLSSLGLSNIEGIDAMGPLHERLSQGSGHSNARNTSRGRSFVPNAVDPTPSPLTSSQPEAIPDSLTTLSEYLNQLRRELAANGTENAMGSVEHSGSTTGESQIPRPPHLAEVVQLTRQLLIREDLSTHLGNHFDMTDPSIRRSSHARMHHTGSLLENLGISLLELGRAAMILRLGQTHDDAVVNTGRNPLWSRSSRAGTSIGGLQAGTAHSSERSYTGMDGVQNGSLESQVAENPSESASAVANGETETVTGTRGDGNFIANALQNMLSSGSAEAGSNSNRQASPREDLEEEEEEEDRRRPSPPLESKCQERD